MQRCRCRRCWRARQRPQPLGEERRFTYGERRLATPTPLSPSARASPQRWSIPPHTRPALYAVALCLCASSVSSFSFLLQICFSHFPSNKPPAAKKEMGDPRIVRSCSSADVPLCATALGCHLHHLPCVCLCSDIFVLTRGHGLAQRQTALPWRTHCDCATVSQTSGRSSLASTTSLSSASARTAVVHAPPVDRHE